MLHSIGSAIRLFGKSWECVVEYRKQIKIQFIWHAFFRVRTCCYFVCSALRCALTIPATPIECTKFSILSDNNKRQFRYDKLFSSSHSLYVQCASNTHFLMALKVIRNEFDKRWHFCIDAFTIAFVKYSALFLVIFKINCIVTWCRRMYYLVVLFFMFYPTTKR